MSISKKSARQLILSKLQWRSLRFLVITGVSAVVLLGNTALLHEVFRAPQELAYGISLVLVFFLNFFSCRHFVFQTPEKHVWIQLFGFAASSGVFRFGEYAAFLVLHTWFGLNYLLAVIGISGVFFVAKFLFHNFVVFRKSTD